MPNDATAKKSGRAPWGHEPHREHTRYFPIPDRESKPMATHLTFSTNLTCLTGPAGQNCGISVAFLWQKPGGAAETHSNRFKRATALQERVRESFGEQTLSPLLGERVRVRASHMDLTHLTLLTHLTYSPPQRRKIVWPFIPESSRGIYG